MNELNVIATARYLAAESVNHVIEQWKLSNDEAKALRLLIDYRDSKDQGWPVRPNVLNLTRLVMLGKITPHEASLLLRFDENYAELAKWEAIDLPSFPVNGHDVMQAGVQAGKLVGSALAKLRQCWVDSGYSATKEQLLELLAREVI